MELKNKNIEAQQKFTGSYKKKSIWRFADVRAIRVRKCRLSSIKRV